MDIDIGYVYSTYVLYVRTYKTGELPEIKSAARTGSHSFAQSFSMK